MPSVRPERADDREAVRRIHELAFGQPDEADLVDALRAAGDHVPELCLVAEQDGDVVGHILFSRARLDAGPEVLALAPMGVLPEHQRQGVGSALVRESMKRAAETEFPFVVVVGHADYYPRFSFGPAAPHGIEAPFEIPPEAWLVHRLPAYSSDARGTVIYAPAFADLD